MKTEASSFEACEHPEARSLRAASARPTSRSRFLALLLLCLAVQQVVAPGQKFFPDDPIWEEGDDLPIPKPAVFTGSKLYDFLHKSFAYQPDPNVPRALNGNTIGGVPNSSWFTNRMGSRPLTLDELKRGPNQLDGPDLSGQLNITSLKLDGVSPGFVFRDPRGEVFFSKVDVADYPQMATSAEVISTKFFHAFGYHVPENYLVFIDPQQLVLAPQAKIQGVSGKRVVITEARLKQILKNVPRRADGRIPVMASRRLPGQILGPFEYLGTRADDPNDLFAHQHHRELRALKIFASWLNHNDSDSTNTLDTYLGEDGKGHVRHYLIDFGTTLGSGAVVPHPRRAGYEYFIEKGPMLKALASLGLWTRPWQTVKVPEYASIGFFGAEIFDPPAWRPDYPNPAFQNLQNEDAFWATRIVMSFTDEMVRALVETGQLEDPEAGQYLLATLLERRDRIIRYYLRQLNPLDDWRVENGSDPEPELRFRNLGEEAGLATAESYRYQWAVFDNTTEARTPLGEERSTERPSIPIPAHVSPYLVVRVQTRSTEANWEKFVDVYLENGSPPRVVGVEREN